MSNAFAARTVLSAALVTTSSAALGGCVEPAPDGAAEPEGQGATTATPLIADTGDLGWALALSPSTPSYEPDPRFAFNNRLRPITVTREGVGAYRVVFEGMTQGNGNPHVVAFGSNANRCKVAAWGFGAVWVRCHAPSGAAADTAFAVFYAVDRVGPGAYAWANNPTASHTPSTTLSWNSSGGSNYVERTGVGSYRVRFNDLDRLDGHVLVTAYGSDPTHCKPSFWGRDGRATVVDVRCFTTGGTRADSRFTVRWMNRSIGYTYGAFAWFDQPLTPSYEPNHLYSVNSEGGSNQALLRNGTGQYVDRFPRIPYTGTVLVTAYGDDSSTCKVREWRGNEGNIDPKVDCYSASGARVDSPHNTYVTSPKPDCWTDCSSGVCAVICA